MSRRAGHGPLTIGYVETKDMGTDLEDIEKDSRRAEPETANGKQLKRYRAALPNLLLTDYLEFRWYVDGELRRSVRLGRLGKGRKISTDQDGAEEVAELLQAFLEHRGERIAKPKELALRMARLTHMIRDIIVEAFENNEASHVQQELREAFAKALLPNLDQPAKTGEFADMYAQTIAYGLFAARCNHSEAKGPFPLTGAIVISVQPQWIILGESC